MKADEVKRYSVGALGEFESDTGCWIRYSDFLAFAKEAEEDKSMGKRWHKAAKELMQTATALQSRLDESGCILKEALGPGGAERFHELLEKEVRLDEAVKALEKLQNLCGEQGWWLKGFAVDAMDTATKAISKAKAGGGR